MVERLNIVDEKGKVIGEEDRDVIHEKGLLHREINIWFYTPKGEVILQHRGKNKDSNPDLLDATVGGHVGIGEDFEVAAIKEAKEETGLEIKKEDLEFLFLNVNTKRAPNPKTGKINNAFVKVYAYQYKGDIQSLQIEKGEGQGFEIWSFETLLALSEKEKKRFGSRIHTTDLISQLKRHWEQMIYEN